MHKHFMIGETKFVELEVRSRDGEQFAIPSATWSLESMGREIDHGTATIEGHRISVLLTAPDAVGQYKLNVWYSVPPETICAKVIIDVND